VVTLTIELTVDRLTFGVDVYVTGLIALVPWLAAHKRDPSTPHRPGIAVAIRKDCFGLAAKLGGLPPRGKKRKRAAPGMARPSAL
jgi:hypothetical protein